MLRKCFLIAVAATVMIASCSKDPLITDDGKIAGNIAFSIPDGWPAPVYQFEGNTLTADGFELGRKLFFDQRLSRDGSTSCGSCHQPFSAFAQLDHPVSHGVDNLLGTRNSPALFNLNWHKNYFWDGGVVHIELQPINPIQNPVEMGDSIKDVVNKLATDAGYRQRFKAAFGTEEVNSQRIFKALSQFMGMLVSSNSKYDHYVRHEAGGDMNASELNGLQVFRAHCVTCHTEPLFSDFSFRNNGLTPSPVYKDSGRMHITGDPADRYKFKVPSLRNLKYTHPYMHDGRFNTLTQVLDHYATGIDHSMSTLDPALQQNITLTAQERTDLLNFLNTLNDETFVKDPRFQEVKQ
jgi:cytochrome c peroxidase